MSSLNQILETIKASVNRIGSFASKRQDPLLREVLGLVKKLETKGDNIQNNINNLKVLNQIKSKVERLMIDDKYISEVKSFVQSYNDLQNIHNEYFSKFNAKWKPAKSLNILKNSAIETTINSFTETGIEVGVTDGIKKILLENITNGGSYFDLTEQLRKHITGAERSEGAVERYVRTFATTSINQFSAEYNKSIADDLGLEWYGYSGSLLETSRDWCEKCVEKKFIHVSEFPALLEGDFGSLGSVKISKSTGLPAGLMKGTNETNLVRRRGGWNCGHQMLAVNESIVPDNIKNAVYATQAYKNWAAKNGKKAIEGKQPDPESIIIAKDMFKRSDRYNELLKNATKDNAIGQFETDEQEAVAINAYTDIDYIDVNRILRGVKESTDEWDKEIAVLKYALQKLPAFTGQVYRGARLPESDIELYQNALENGKPIVHKYFTSSTYDIGKKFSGNAMFFIESKNGRMVEKLSSYPNEKEVLFNSGTEFKVTQIIKEGERVQIFLEEL